MSRMTIGIVLLVLGIIALVWSWSAHVILGVLLILLGVMMLTGNLMKMLR